MRGGVRQWNCEITVMNRLWFLAAVAAATVFTCLACGSETARSEDAEEALAVDVAKDERRAQRPGQRTEIRDAKEQQREAALGEVIFLDELIEETVRLELRQPEGPIMIAEVEQFTSFSMALQLYVADISGLEHMINLTEFDVTQNTVSDLTPLAGLTKLARLDLAQNDITDISALSELSNLRFLRLKDNRVSDISVLANLTELTELDLWENEIDDISALGGLTKLTKLNLTSNNISDISPLASLSDLIVLELAKNEIADISPLLEAGLGEGVTIRLWGVPLNEHSVEVVIPQLEEAGVRVDF